MRGLLLHNVQLLADVREEQNVCCWHTSPAVHSTAPIQWISTARLKRWILASEFHYDTISLLELQQSGSKTEREAGGGKNRQYSRCSTAHNKLFSPRRRRACRAAWCCRSCRRSSPRGRPGPWQCSRCLHLRRSLHSLHSGLLGDRGREAETTFTTYYRSDNL